MSPKKKAAAAKDSSKKDDAKTATDTSGTDPSAADGSQEPSKTETTMTVDSPPKEIKDDEDAKRKREEDELKAEEAAAKKTKTGGGSDEPAPVPPSKEGASFFNDNDVLSGRGGGTNVHPGNRNFRDLINLHRRAYLKARKNDKPGISRAIVRAVRDAGGHFLRKDEKSGLWFEIGDDAAREKTSQALRQRAPEMRKLLFDTEREEARLAAQEQFRQQRILMGMPPDMNMPNASGNGSSPPSGMQGGMQMPPFPNPAMFAMAGKNGGMPPMPPGADPYTQMAMFSAFMGAGMSPPQQPQQQQQEQQQQQQQGQEEQKQQDQQQEEETQTQPQEQEQTESEVVQEKI